MEMPEGPSATHRSSHAASGLIASALSQGACPVPTAEEKQISIEGRGVAFCRMLFVK
jgi:hypothetical protein